MKEGSKLERFFMCVIVCKASSIKNSIQQAKQMVAPLTVEILFEKSSPFLAAVLDCSKPFSHFHVFEPPSHFAFQFLAEDLTFTQKRKNQDLLLLYIKIFHNSTSLIHRSVIWLLLGFCCIVFASLLQPASFHCYIPQFCPAMPYASKTIFQTTCSLSSFNLLNFQQNSTLSHFFH